MGTNDNGSFYLTSATRQRRFELVLEFSEIEWDALKSLQKMQGDVQPADTVRGILREALAARGQTTNDGWVHPTSS